MMDSPLIYLRDEIIEMVTAILFSHAEYEFILIRVPKKKGEETNSPVINSVVKSIFIYMRIGFLNFLNGYESDSLLVS